MLPPELFFYEKMSTDIKTDCARYVENHDFICIGTCCSMSYL